MKVLLVEDDKQTADFVMDGLVAQRCLVDHAADGREGLLMAAKREHDVIVLDRMLPVLDGLSIVRALRSTGVATPILYLTTMSGIDDRVDGLDAGGDDYLVKPFAMVELLARLRALARRPQTLVNEHSTHLRVADLEMDLLKRRVTRGDLEIDLLPREFKLLEYLLRNAERLVTRAMLLEIVWRVHFDTRTSVVESHISRLRSKIDTPGLPELIHTIRKAGYMLRAPE